MNSHAISLFQNQYGSDEDLPENLKPKFYENNLMLDVLPRTELKKRKRRNKCMHVLQWLQWLCRFERRKSKEQTDYNLIDTALNPSRYKKKPCKLSFLFDPSGRFIYIWTMLVSIAFLYNLWIVGYRYTFNEIERSTIFRWFCLDYTADIIYLLDIALSFRTAFIREGVLQTNFLVIRQHYTNSWRFYVDCFSLLPFDFLYLSFGFCSILRWIRLIKIYKMMEFLDATERHTNNPTCVKICILVHHLLLVFHLNACLLNYFRDTFVWEDGLMPNNTSIKANYLTMYSQSCRSLLLMNKLVLVEEDSTTGLILVITEQVGGILLIATVFGTVTNILTQLGAAKKHFQAELDGVKTYMHRCQVPPYLQLKVTRWFDYIWRSNRAGKDNNVLNCLPEKLHGEISIQVHLDTLKRVEIFRNTEPGFLCDLVLRCTHLLFSPGDYVCRRGEVGKEMYIIREGRLHVVSDDGTGVLAVLSAGHYFGINKQSIVVSALQETLVCEISLLNLCEEGNRRTASVIACGYCELLCLSQKDMWQVLEDYPNARHRMEQIANRRLQEQKISNFKNSLRKVNSPANRRKSCASMPTPMPPVQERGDVQKKVTIATQNNLMNDFNEENDNEL